MQKNKKPNLIVVTRPLPAGKELCNEIEREGGETLLFPTIEIKPLPISEEILKELPNQDWIIFISPQSVYTSQLSIPKNIKIAAIGEGTAKALRAANYAVAAKPKEEWNSESLLALPQFKQIENKKITIVKGVGGKEVLTKELQKRGAIVTLANAYERMLPQVDTNILKSNMLKESLEQQSIGIFVCTSKDNLQNLKTLLQSAWQEVKKIPVIVISDNMYHKAQELGFEKILIAQNASHQAIITVLKKGLFMENTKQNESPAKPINWAKNGILISAFGFIILFAGLYIANMRMLHTQASLAKINEQLVAKIDENQQTIYTLQNTLNNTQQNFQTLREEVTSQEQTVNTLRNKALTNQDQWSVNEAHYLVKLANDNLQISENLPLIITLLQTADSKLRDSTDPKIIALRKALTEDITTFQALQSVDITGIYLKLAALNNAVDKLALPNNRPVADENTSTTNKRLPWWKKGLQQTWNSLKQIVIVRYNASGEMPFIAPGQQDFLYQNLHAKYEQAMWALMNRQEEIYKTSLQQTQLWIAKYFLQDDPATQAQIANLKELENISIDPKLPTLDKTMEAFNSYFADTAKSNSSTVNKS